MSRDRAGSLTVPARCAALHPAPDRDVAVGWCSPIRGRLAELRAARNGRLERRQWHEWSVVREGKSKWQILARGAIDTGGSQDFPADTDAKKLAEVAVEAGDVLSLVVGAKGGDHLCDTTIVELQFAEVGGAGRVLNLTRTWSTASTPVIRTPMFSATPAYGSLRFQRPSRAVLQPGGRTRRHAGVCEGVGRPRHGNDSAACAASRADVGCAMGAMFPGKTLPAIPKPAFEPPMKVEGPWRNSRPNGIWHVAPGAAHRSG